MKLFQAVRGVDPAWRRGSARLNQPELTASRDQLTFPFGSRLEIKLIGRAARQPGMLYDIVSAIVVYLATFYALCVDSRSKGCSPIRREGGRGRGT